MASAMPRAADNSTGTITMDVDPVSGRINVIGTGYWSPSYIDSHFKRVADLVRSHRSAGIPIRVLVDLRKSDVQSRDTIEHLGRNTAQIYNAGDKVALLMASSLGTMQMRRAAHGTPPGFFASLEDAEDWLAAE